MTEHNRHAQPDDREVYDRLLDAFVERLGLSYEPASAIVRRMPRWLRHDAMDEISVCQVTEESLNEELAEPSVTLAGKYRVLHVTDA